MAPIPSHYELLELPAAATAEELRQAFRRLSKRYHPDTTSLPAEQARQAFAQLRAAYAVLADPHSRRVYDQQLAAASAPPVLAPPRLVSVRRALSGGEWLALLLLAGALLLSLVLGLGLAWARGVELMRPPSWITTEPPATAMTTDLPPATTPLYHHPLPALERWLRDLGAVQQGPNGSVWDLHRPEWSARILLDVEDLRVSWQHDGQESARAFPYGLSRDDVQAAILAGP
ncbi:MAG: DUF3143 domain-containing protein [Cyanobacteriota bacterium]|jgi:curved DNA-binding protein CbpA|nr:DUF3143 domain-containing protein [Cyanobacteriota bacterium]